MVMDTSSGFLMYVSILLDSGWQCVLIHGKFDPDEFRSRPL